MESEGSDNDSGDDGKELGLIMLYNSSPSSCF